MSLRLALSIPLPDIMAFRKASRAAPLVSSVPLLNVGHAPAAEPCSSPLDTIPTHPDLLS